jgi:hypothetical protein
LIADVHEADVGSQSADTIKLKFIGATATAARRRFVTSTKIPGYWATPLFAYTSIIIAPILGLLLGTEPGTILTDPAGHPWQVQDIRSVAALACLFTVLAFWLLAVFKVRGILRDLQERARYADKQLVLPNRGKVRSAIHSRRREPRQKPPLHRDHLRPR